MIIICTKVNTKTGLFHIDSEYQNNFVSAQKNTRISVEKCRHETGGPANPDAI